MDEGVENTKSLTIRTVSSGKNNHCKKNLANTMPATQDSLSKNSLANSVSSSPNNSPLISPPSSAFVSASQSPYISPRATTATVVKESLTPPQEIPTPATTTTHPSPLVSCSGSQSDDIPSTSYNDEKLNSAPRISFSFPVPRVSFAKAPASNAKLRSCDVYVGYYGQNPNLIRFCKWLKSELEVQGIACFVADRAKYVDNQSHQIADRVICSASYGVVVVTSYTLLNHLSLEEIRFFAQKKNLIPLFFDTDANEIASMFNPHSDNKECKEAMEGLTKFHEFKLEANDGNWRYCVSKAAGILRGKLGRQSVTEKEIVKFAELPFPRNKYFVGREKEIMEIETTFFSCGDFLEQESVMSAIKSGAPGQSEGLADEESEADAMKGSKYIGLEVGRYKEPDLEAWVEPANARNYLKRQKYKKSKSGKYKGFGNSSIVCINGLSGVGKTELALEFAYRYYQRYKMVMWVGGETRHFRQNILNISLNMGLDLSADEEKKRGRIWSFDEQESEVFKRVKRELFHDMPYLLIIDNLESETEWWEGRDFHDLIPRNTGGTHVLITTRLPKVMNSDPMELQTLPLSDAMTLIKGRRKKEYSVTELEYLGKFDAKLGRSSFGLSLIGSLLSEFAIAPSALFEAVSHIQREEPTNYSSLSTSDQQFCQTSPFLIKVLSFCASLLQQSNGKRNLLASRMLQVGAWFAPAPIPATLLAVAANKMSSTKNKFEKWARISKLAFCCCSSQTWKSEDDSAFSLIRLGLARISNRQPGCWIQFHPITQMFVKWKHGSIAAKAMVRGVRKLGNPVTDSDHLWTSAFLVFGYKSEPPTVQLKAVDMILFIKRTALPLAIRAFTDFSRCNSALELLKVCTNMLEEVEKSFVSQIQDWCHGSLCWKKTPQSNQKVDEYVWEEVSLLKATLLETRAKLLLRGGHFDSGEELCRTCISIRTVMLGHDHAQTLAAQETLAKLVRMRSKI